MSGVDVDGLVKRERDVVAVERSIGRRVEGGHRGLRQASHEFLDVTDTLGRRGGVSGAVAVPERKVYEVYPSGPLARANRHCVSPIE